MQVSQVAELDTHAVIGGGSAEAFGMSDSAEFFTVLSDTLYRDKMRAVAREVICNAWDAHIKCGVDRPIEITLTDEELVIKDFGRGIPHEHLHGTYCIYGYSTKARDENQTGGFGLGSKAPFAYSDHFSVVNCHAGIRSVNAISRGGIETEGKPERREMVRVPTTETGVTVTIPIRSENDRRQFTQHIRQVVYQGGIKAELNDEVVPTVDYGPARALGYALLRVRSNTDLNESGVYVLYGTVLYPVSTTDRALMEQVNKLRAFSPGSHKMVLIAPPSSLGVTPSREALSYTPRTIETISELLKRAETNYRADAVFTAPGMIRTMVERFERYSYSLFQIPQVEWSFREDALIYDRKALAEIATQLRFGDFYDDAKRARMVCNALARKFKDDRRYFRRLHGFNRYKFVGDNYRHSSRLMLRLATRLELLPKLFVHNASWEDCKRLIPVAEFVGRSTAVNETLIVAPTHRDAIKLISKLKNDDKTAVRMAETTMVLVVGRNCEELREKIQNEAAKLKFSAVEADFPTVKRARKKESSEFFDLSKLRKDSYKWATSVEPTLATPKYYYVCSGTAQNLNIHSRLVDKRSELTEHFPDTAILWTQRQIVRAKALGAKELTGEILRFIKPLAKRPDVLFAWLRTKQLLITNCGYWDGGYAAQQLAAHDHRLAQLLFPGAPKASEHFKKLDWMLDLLRYAPNGSKETREDIAKTIDDIEKAAKLKFADYILDSKAASEKFKHLSILNGIRLEKANIEQVILLVKTLQRDHIKRQSASQMKEAA